LHRIDKSVAAARHCFDIARLFSRFPEDIAQSPDRRIDAVVEFDHGLIRPKPIAYLLSQDDLTGVFQQQEQELEGLLAQTKTDTMLAQFAGPNIQIEGSETILARPQGRQISHG